MNCEIIFTVDGQTISLEVESSTGLLSDNIIKGLQEKNDKKIELYNAIQNALYGFNPKKLSLSSLIKSEGLVGNTTSEQLALKFGIDFPKDTNVEVLFVKDIKVSKISIYDRINTHDGREVFIINDNGKSENEDVKHLANFLRTRKIIEDGIFNFSEDSLELKELNACLLERNKKKNKVNDIKEMLLEYIHNKDKYSNLVIKDESGKNQEVYNILLRIIGIINDYSQKPNYKDAFIDSLNKRLSYKNKSKQIEFKRLYDLLNIHYKNLFKALELTSLKKFKSSFNNSYIFESIKKIDLETIKDDDVKAIIKELQQLENPKIENIFQILLRNDPDFLFKFSRSDDEYVYFDRIYHTLESKYGISYNTTKLFKVLEVYKGFKIYLWNDDGINKYFFSLEHAIPGSRDNLIEKGSEDTLDNIKQMIDEIVSKQELYKNSLIQFKFRNLIKNDKEVEYEDELSSYNVESDKSLITKSIIDSIDIPVNSKTVIYNGEDFLFSPKQTLQDFYDVINKWNISDNTKLQIKSKIDTPEKAIVFIYKINERLKSDRTNDTEILKLIDEIYNAPIKSYFIKLFKGKYNNKYRYEIIPTNPDQVERARTEPYIPMVRLVQAISKVFGLKFNVLVEALTSEEISEMFKDVNPNTSKAFIRNGIIYVNVTLGNSLDLIHEYTHLLLGVLKSDSNLRSNYELLMYLIADMFESDLIQLKSTYPNLSLVDLMEELFAIKFSEYITKKVTPNSDKIESIFKENKKLLETGSKLIFNDNIDNLLEFYGKTLNEVFLRFTHDVSLLLKGSKELNFGNTALTRKYSNWISKLIEDKKIEENCE